MNNSHVLLTTAPAIASHRSAVTVRTASAAAIRYNNMIGRAVMM